MNRPQANHVNRRGPVLGARFFLLAVLCIGVMALDHQANHLDRIRGVLSAAVHPIRLTVDLPVFAWRWAGRSLGDRQQLLEENDYLKRQQLDLNVRLQRLAAVEAENTRLRQLMKSTARVADQVLVAEILAVDLDPYRHRFAINKGTGDGVFVGQALLDAGGVVGQIVRTEPFSSEAILISDADHALPIQVNRNGLRTIALGTGTASELRLPYLPNNADIQVGDLLVSSGLGGGFPADYPVAKITEVQRRPGQAFAAITARPTAALDRAREVLLVWNHTLEKPNNNDSGPAGDSLAEAN